jgi:predicted AAA+ superfamily ATPase
MREYIQRKIEGRVRNALGTSPVVALIGPRQCGKSTMARAILESYPDAVRLDLERPSDLRKIENAEYYLEQQSDRLVCLDEIQRVPEIFPLLRVLVDENRRPGRYLILGSASRDLLRQSSESLAGRVVYHELTPFLANEVRDQVGEKSLWVRGGYPESLLASDDTQSLEWREGFIQTFLERDLMQFGFSMPSTTMRRFWSMLAHNNGQTINYSKLGQSLDVSHTTMRRWLDVLEATFMVRVLPPYLGNLKKRLVKSPKVYIRDSGLLHALLALDSHDSVLGHPVAGASWEGFAMEQILAEFPRCDSFFYRTAHGREIDLILERGDQRVGVEFKLGAAPRLSNGIASLIDELEIKGMILAAPVATPYMPSPNIYVENLTTVADRIHGLLET